MSGCWEQACERVSNTQSWGGRQCAGDGLGGRSLRPGFSGRGSLCVPTLRLTAVVEEQLAADQAVLPERETPLFIRPRVASIPWLWTGDPSIFTTQRKAAPQEWPKAFHGIQIELL